MCLLHIRKPNNTLLITIKNSIDCFYHNRVYFKASMKIMKSVYLISKLYFPSYINDIKDISFIKFGLHYFHTQLIIYQINTLYI